MARLRLRVLAGQRQEHVGFIEPQAGMLTNEGTIDRVTPKGVVIGSQRFRKLDGLSVRHTEALRYGYPTAKGSTRLRTRLIRRGGETIPA